MEKQGANASPDGSHTAEKHAIETSEHYAGSDDRLSVVDFGGDSTLPPPPILTPEQEKALYRKVDMKLMPILAAMYLLSFLDRGASLPNLPVVMVLTVLQEISVCHEAT
jgi:hypothetical protein